jgi:hypothetical protein
MFVYIVEINRIYDTQDFVIIQIFKYLQLIVSNINNNFKLLII